jgi:glycosyltransferase involved in cell wall biosynthesis
MTDLSVSVIIPVFNGERFLAEAIESVLAQAYHPLEIIVIDDGSTDSTAEIAHRFADQISYIRQPNRGPAAARNAGLRRAQGDLIGFLDADDLWTPDKLASQEAAFTKSPSVKIVLGHLQRLKPARTHGFVPHGSPELALNLGASLIRRQVFHAVGTFDESLRFGDDWDWYMRVRELGVSILVQNDVVLFYRRHDANLTNQREENDRATVQILRRSLERRRKRHGRASSLPPVRGSTPEDADPQDEPERR